MDRESERELAVVISEEKAKVVLGGGYSTLAYPDWVEELKCFVQISLVVSDEPCKIVGRNGRLRCDLESFAVRDLRR